MDSGLELWKRTLLTTALAWFVMNIINAATFFGVLNRTSESVSRGQD